MKTIFRSLNIGLILASIIAFGAVAGFAQDPCADAEGQTTLGDKVRAQYADKTIEGRKAFVESGKQFLEKYGACEPAKELSDYLKVQIPKVEGIIKEMIRAKRIAELTGRFDTALKGKNWDAVYAAGKEILQEFPDEFRTVEIVLGAIGGEEAFKANFKYNDDALRFAKQSITDLEGGKPFILGGKPRFGLSLKDSYNFEFATKEDAIGWLNLYIGYIIQVGQKNKVAAAPYLFKATQAADTAKNPVPYELIGGYYFDELNKIVEQIQIKAKDQKDTDAPDVAQKKIDDIKALVAMSNGTSERAMDAFSRAYTFGKDAPYKARMKKNVEDAYKLRFSKTEGVDAWIAGVAAKPFINPTTPIAPISDPEPVKTDASGVSAANGTGVGAANGTGVGAANGSGVGAANGTGVGNGAAPKTVVNTTPVKNTTPPAKPPVKKPVSKKAVVKKKKVA
ncbi:MAG: hypothetical protein ACKVQJ_15580 [Pyrinomonadaceae bacterium]